MKIALFTALLFLTVVCAAEVVDIKAGDYNITLVIPFAIDNITMHEPVAGETYGGIRYTSYNTYIRPAIMYEEISPNWVGESNQGETVDIDVTVYARPMKVTQRNLKGTAKDERTGLWEVEYFNRTFAGKPGVLGVSKWTIPDLLGGTVDGITYKAVWWLDYDDNAASGIVKCVITTSSKWDFTRSILNSIHVE